MVFIPTQQDNNQPFVVGGETRVWNHVLKYYGILGHHAENIHGELFLEGIYCVDIYTYMIYIYIFIYIYVCICIAQLVLLMVPPAMLKIP